MIKLVASEEFAEWLDDLRDAQAKKRISARLDRAQMGNLGDVKAVGSGISEMRIPHGPGYRLYFTQRGNTLILLLYGGDKSTQSKDIARAKKIAEAWEI